jgi:hypothetical protein
MWKMVMSLWPVSESQREVLIFSSRSIESNPDFEEGKSDAVRESILCL